MAKQIQLIKNWIKNINTNTGSKNAELHVFVNISNLMH